MTEFEWFLSRLDEELRGGADTRQAVRLVIADTLARMRAAPAPVTISSLHRTEVRAGTIGDALGVMCSCGWHETVWLKDYDEGIDAWSHAYKIGREHELGVIKEGTA